MLHIVYLHIIDTRYVHDAPTYFQDRTAGFLLSAGGRSIMERRVSTAPGQALAGETDMKDAGWVYL